MEMKLRFFSLWLRPSWQPQLHHPVAVTKCYIIMFFYDLLQGRVN